MDFNTIKTILVKKAKAIKNSKKLYYVFDISVVYFSLLKH